MADRWRVGAGGAMTDTSHWAAIQNGAPGQSAPTTGDRAYFDQYSSGTIIMSAPMTVAVLDFTQGTGFTGTIHSITNSSNFFTIKGSASYVGTVKLSTGMSFILDYSGPLTFSSGGTVNSVFYTNGQTIDFSVTINDSAHGCSFKDNVNSSFTNGSYSVTVTAGTWDCALITMTALRGVSIANSSSAKINGTGANITCPAWSMGWNAIFTTSPLKITLSPVANVSNTYYVFDGGGVGNTYTEVVLNTAISELAANGNRFTKLTKNLIAGAQNRLQIDADIQVDTLFTCAGAANNRQLITSNNDIQTQITCTSAHAAVSYTDFFGIKSSVTWSGKTRLGDCGNNTNISFDAPVTRYWINNGGTISDTAHWSATDNGAGGASAPIAQDTAIINNHSITSINQVITIPLTYSVLGTLNFTGVLNNPCLTTNDFTGYSNVYLVGSFILEDGMTTNITNASTPTFRFQWYGKTPEVAFKGAVSAIWPLSFYSYGSATAVSQTADIRSSSDVIISGVDVGGVFTWTWNINGHDMYAKTFFCYTVPITMSNPGTIYVTGSASAGNTTFDCSSNVVTVSGLNVVFSDTSNLDVKIALGSINVTCNIRITGGYAGKNYLITAPAGGASILILQDNDGTYTHNLKFPNTNPVHIANWQVSGSAAHPITVTNTSSTTKCSIVKDGGGTAQGDYLNISNCAASPVDSFYSGAHSQITASTGWGLTPEKPSFLYNLI